MNRKDFIKTLGLTTLSIPMITSLSSFEKLTDSFQNSERMPALFLGHGSPMNAIEDNEFVRELKLQGTLLGKPNAIIVISAHWETNGTYITAMQNPRTIHDFGGFPKELYEVQYPAPGNPELAKEVSELIKPKDTVHLDHKWGLDHGAWTVVKHLFPEANIPIVLLSIDYTKDALYHYNLANQLQKLRDKGVLIIGSGNIVHNLGQIAWNKLNENYAYDWAVEANDKIKQWILNDNHQNLIDFKKQGNAFNLAIPTPEHYLPLLYAMSLKNSKDSISLFNDKPLAGSLSMTSVKVG